MGKQKDKRKKRAAYLASLQKQARCTHPGESALLGMKAHPSRQLSESELKANNIDYWQSDFDRWLKKHKK